MVVAENLSHAGTICVRAGSAPNSKKVSGCHRSSPNNSRPKSTTLPQSPARPSKSATLSARSPLRPSLSGHLPVLVTASPQQHQHCGIMYSGNLPRNSSRTIARLTHALGSNHIPTNDDLRRTGLICYQGCAGHPPLAQLGSISPSQSITA